jgi:hypothetical protein
MSEQGSLAALCTAKRVLPTYLASAPQEGGDSLPFIVIAALQYTLHCLSEGYYHSIRELLGF